MKKKLIILFFLSIIAFLQSCKTKLEPLSTKDVDVINEKLMDSTSTEPSLRGKGLYYKKMQRFFTDCFKNYVFRKGEFTGFSNSITVGDLIREDGTSGYKLSKLLPEKEYSEYVYTGNNAELCSKTSKSLKEFQVELAAQIINVTSPELKSRLSLQDSIVFNSLNFKVINLNVDMLEDAINDGDPKLTKYIKQIKESKRTRVVTQIVKCSSADFTVYVNQNLDNGLQAKLEPGFIDSTKIGDVSVKTKFTRVSSNKVQAKVSEEFVLFINTVSRKGI